MTEDEMVGWHQWLNGHQFSSVQLLSHVWFSVTPWTAARQASLSITDSRSLLKLTSTESVMPSNHLILCCPLLLLPSILPSTRIFSNESALRIRWPKYQVSGHEFEQTPAAGEGQGSLVCFSPWGCRVRHNCGAEHQQPATVAHVCCPSPAWPWPPRAGAENGNKAPWKPRVVGT